MKLKLLFLSLHILFLTISVFANDNVTVTIELPEGISVSYLDLKVVLFGSNGRRLGKSISVQEGLTFTYPSAYAVEMLQVKKRAVKKNLSAKLFFAAMVENQQNEQNINSLTTVRALFAREIIDIYSSIQDSDKQKANLMIVALLDDYKIRLEEQMQAEDYSLQDVMQVFKKESDYINKVNKINATLSSAIESGLLKLKAQMSINEVQEIFEELISCKENPITFESNPDKSLIVRTVMQNEIQRAESGHLLKRKLQLFGAKVTQIFPGSIGISPGFAAILEIDIPSLRVNVEASGMDLTQCTDNGCEIEINEKATLLLTDSALFMGPKNNSKSSTILGCVYPYVR